LAKGKAADSRFARAFADDSRKAAGINQFLTMLAEFSGCKGPQGRFGD
jgi:hypothetical protein